jgi:alpha-D-ribose 1-methylphosphonate 5-triphosphate synthase subunit PhnH
MIIQKKPDGNEILHHIQSAYRLILNAMSCPGSIFDLQMQAQSIKHISKIHSCVLLLGLMFLDAEVSFCMVTKQDEYVSGILNQLTYARAVSLSDADYIFILEDAETEEIEDAFMKAKTGTLINPHQSATLLMSVPLICPEGDLVLSGPGIEITRSIGIEGIKKYLSWREKKNIEYPLGIDLIVLDSMNKMACLPRTTQVKLAQEL